MALTLTIGASNYLPQYKTNSFSKTESLQNRANSMRMDIVKKSGQSAPSEGQEIIFKDGSRFLFAGYVSNLRPSEVGKGDLITYGLEATDYTYVLINKVAQKTYNNQTLKAIAEDLLSTYIDAGYGFTSADIETGPTITTIAFNHVSLRTAFEKLAKLSGMEWWVDYEKGVHFVSKESIPAPENVTDNSENYYNLAINCDTSQVRNEVIVKGGREETDTFFSQIFVADGEAREWILREKPSEMEFIKLNTVAQDVGVDPIDDEDGNDFMFNYQEKFIRCTATTTTPAADDEIEVSYKYEVPVIVRLRSSSSILAMKAIEGGDGIHAQSITDKAIKSKDEARQRALKELQEYANPLLNGVFETRTGLLTAGSIFEAGQELTVNLPTWGISTDTKYLVQEVTTTLLEDGSNIEYNYKVKFGGRLLGIRSFLESLAAKEEVILDTEEIDRVELVDELVTITEQITKDGNEQSITEGLAVAEQLTKTRQMTPFLWGPPGALSFATASSEYVTTDRSGTSFSQITIMAWVKPSSLGQNGIVSLGAGVLLRLNSDTVQWWPNTGSAPADTASLGFIADDIFHVAVTHNNTGQIAKIYVNGVDVTQTGQAANISTNTNITYIGTYANSSSWFNGVITEVRIWDVALTADEILEAYNGGDVQIANYIEIYPFLEGSGSTTNDKSGNGYVGTLQNTPTWASGIGRYHRILRWNLGEWS